jgi:hypothetical protein
MCGENQSCTVLMPEQQHSYLPRAANVAASMERIWSGLDRSGNPIVVTRDAFGLCGRLHVWQLSDGDGNGGTVLKRSLMADNLAQFPAIEIPGIEL